MKYKISKKFTAILLALCLALSMSVSATQPARTEAGVFGASAINMAVNKLYTFGLSTIGTGISKLGESSDNPDFEALTSFLDKWVFGNGQKKANTALIDLCKQILAELKVIETTMAEYTAQIEQSIGEQNFTEAMKSVNSQWELDVHSLENNGIEDALEKYRNYMDVAQRYADKKATEADMDRAKAALFNEFCNMYKNKHSVPVDANTPEKLRPIIFGDTVVNDMLHSCISSMKNNLVKDTNYADVLAQFSYQALPFANQQYEYIKAGINQQMTEITLVEMLHQEFLSQYGDYLEEAYPDDQEKWNGYVKFLNDFNILNEETAVNMAAVLDRELKVYPAQGITLRLNQYPTEDDTAEVVLHNKEFQKTVGYVDANKTYYQSKPKYFSENEKFRQAFTLTNSGINNFYIKTAPKNEAMRLTAFDYKFNVSMFPDEHNPTCDYYNIAEKHYTNGNKNTNMRPALNPAELSQLFNTNAYNMSGSVALNYLSEYLSYAGQNEAFLLFPGYTIGHNSIFSTGYGSFTKVFQISQARPYADITGNRTSKMSFKDIQPGNAHHDAYYSIIYINESGADQYTIRTSRPGNGSSDLYLLNGSKHVGSLDVKQGTTFTVRFKANDGTVLKSLKLQRRNDAADKNKVTRETVLLTREQLADMTPEEDGYYTFSCQACYADETIVLETAKGYKAQTRNTGAFPGEITFDGGTDTYLSGDTVSFSVSKEVSRVCLQYGDVKEEIPLSDYGSYGILGEFVMPASAVTLVYETKDANHVYNAEGFCSNPGCGFYEPAVLNTDGAYEIGNAGQFFWFASLVNGDSSHAEYNEKNTAAAGRLTADINLGEREWTPIRDFHGMFDGEHHIISGLKITKTQDDTGLFGKVKGATICNLSVKGSIVLSGNAKQIAGVIGHADGGDFEHIFSYVDISNIGGTLVHVGGVVGCIENAETKVNRCANYGTMDIASSNDCIGGVAGYSNGGGRITNCANHGTVHTTMENAFTGGILGYVNNSSVTVQNCYNTGTVSNGTNPIYCGAIIGFGKRYDAAKITNNYYLDTSAAHGFGNGGQSNGTAVSKRSGAFSSGEVTYLLNHSITDGTQVWYQNVDNGKTPDNYPVFDGGTVYYLTDTQTYSNFSGLPDAFEKDEHGNLIIRTYDDLVKLSKLVRSDYGIYGSQNYILKNNIVVDTNTAWKMGIGSVAENKPFNGTFNANGYCIMGLQIASPEYGGVFEYIGSKGTVKNLITLNDRYLIPCANAGSIAAVNDGVIDHCSSGINVSPYLIFPHPNTKKPVQAITFNSQITGTLSGGIAAQNRGSIIGCRNAATVTGTECGGIAGINTGTIYGCANNGTVGEANSTQTAGGITGKNGGRIESSYHAANIYSGNANASGAIAGLYGFDTETSPQIAHVFYQKADHLQAVGTNSLVTAVDQTVIAKDAASMQSDAFTEELNNVTDQDVSWCRSLTLNGGYPKVENNLFQKSVQKSRSGVSVKGSMHSSLNISYEACGESSEAYQELVSDISQANPHAAQADGNGGSKTASGPNRYITADGEREILKGYSVSLTDADGTPVLPELWVQGTVEVSVPAEQADVLLVGIGSNGQVIESSPSSFKNGTAVFQLSEPVSFVIAANKEPGKSSLNAPAVKAASPGKTGDPAEPGLWVLVISLVLALMVGTAVVTIRRRKVMQ